VADSGIDWTCPECGSVVVSGARERQLLDLLLRCHDCGTVAGSPTRQPGEPFPGLVVAFGPGEYLEPQIDIASKPNWFVGYQAIDRYLLEIGSPSAPGAPPGDADFELTPGGLRAAAARAQSLLGERYADLIAKDERRRNSATQRHRLTALLTYAREAADALELAAGGPMALDGDLLAELAMTLSLIDRWSNHPTAADLVGTLADPTEGQHTVMMLAVASNLADTGNHVGLETHAVGGGRIPDIWSEPTLLERLNIEVKTPQPLRAPENVPVSVEDGEQIIATQIKKAASTGSGQLDPQQPGILVVGGFHLGEGSLDNLAAAALNLLKRESEREHKRHLAFVIVADLTYEVQTGADATGNAVEFFRPLVETRFVRRPGYSGSFDLRRAAPPEPFPGPRSTDGLAVAEAPKP
jgi:hypothetical protein